MTQVNETVVFETRSYRWSWSPPSDNVIVTTPTGYPIFEFPLQPCIQMSRAPGEGGHCTEFQQDGDELLVTYEGVNGDARLSLRVGFSPEYFVMNRVVYESRSNDAVVQLRYCASWEGGAPRPAGIAETCVVPGGRQHPERAIFETAGLQDVRFSIGCFGMGLGTYHQQWGLPHYLLACQSGAQDRPPAICIGLGALPDGSVMAVVDEGRVAYEISYRSDLWDHRTDSGAIAFEEPFVFAIGDDWYASVGGYFDALLAEGWATAKRPSDVPEAAFWPQYDTWGDQCLRGCSLERFDESHLRAIYADFRTSGLRSRLFVIDDKWERQYGSLEHDPERFTRFPELLDEIRESGCEIGIWTAFPRCQDYASLGLPPEAVLRTPDGHPYLHRDGRRSWHIFDPTNEQAAAYLGERARHLVRTYRPKLVKIDFGYEIPPPSIAAPHDMRWAGERLFRRFLDVVVGPIKDEDPSVAVLYYCLTPFFNRYLDISGVDDLWMSRGAYGDAFARRALLSSLCGHFGIVPYGSSGYDWRSISEIWLDSAIIGTPGVIAPLAGDEYGERLTPQLAALYNGIARLTRRNPIYRVQLIDSELRDPDTGPVARSWARHENGRPVALVLRPRDGRAVAPDLGVASCRVAIASLTDESITSCASLGLVSLDPGRVQLRREGQGTPYARAMWANGDYMEIPCEVRPGSIQLDMPVASPSGVPVEMVQIDFR